MNPALPCSCSDFIRIQCETDRICSDCITDRSQVDRITLTSSRRLADCTCSLFCIADQPYKGLHVGRQQYLFIFDEWTSECICFKV